MTQFSIDQPTTIKVTSVNVRSELHGEEHVPAADIFIRYSASNEVLSEFDGSLRSMLYKKAAGQEQQPGLDGVQPISDLPALRTTAINQPIKLTKEYVGYALTVDRGLGGSSNITLEECGVDKIRCDCKEGGTVEVSLRISASKLSADVLGKLATLIGSEVEITLLPADVKQEELPIKPPRGSGPKPKKDATDAFVDAHAGQAS